MSEAKPLQILFKGEVIATIDQLKEVTGSKSRADVIRDAIKLYSIVVEVSDGKPLVVKQEAAKKGKIIYLPHKQVTINENP